MNPQQSNTNRKGAAKLRYLCFAFLGALGLSCLSQPNLKAAAGDIYVVAGHRDPEDIPLILRYDSNRTRSVFASGGTPYGLAFDRAGNLFASTATGGSILKYSPDGKSTVFTTVLGRPGGIALDRDDNVFVAEITGNAILRFTPDGTKTVFASGLNKPGGIAFDKAGNLLCTEIGSGQVLRFSQAGEKSVIASGLNSPTGLACDNKGNAFVIEGAAAPDGTSSSIYKIAPDGTMSLFRRVLYRGLGLCFDPAGNVVATDNPTGVLFVFDPQGKEIWSDSLGVQSPIYVAIEPATSASLNISTRMRALTADNALIAGFILTGTDSKKVVLRAIGPSLSDFGVGGALVDPTLELHDQSGKVIATNDDWRDPNPADISGTGIPPKSDKESAIVTTLAPGSYTAVVRGKGETAGVALVEIYDLSAGTPASLANISTRGYVDTGTNVMIGGFIIGSGSGARVVIRGLGPSLSAVGISNPLTDPTLDLRDGNGNRVRADDNWKDQQQQEIDFVNLAPIDDHEAAIAATLLPGNYTAILAGAGGGTGTGLLEVYNVK